MILLIQGLLLYCGAGNPVVLPGKLKGLSFSVLYAAHRNGVVFSRGNPGNPVYIVRLVAHPVTGKE